VGAVLGLDVVPMPDRWTYPHVALGYGRRTEPSDGLAGWLAHLAPRLVPGPNVSGGL
jgi:hypothetical protein